MNQIKRNDRYENLYKKWIGSSSSSSMRWKEHKKKIWTNFSSFFFFWQRTQLYSTRLDTMWWINHWHEKCLPCPSHSTSDTKSKAKKKQLSHSFDSKYLMVQNRQKWIQNQIKSVSSLLAPAKPCHSHRF